MNGELQGFQKTWGFKRPLLTRYLEKEFVDQFFEEGVLQLSSFKAFRGHSDEDRGDVYEGRSTMQISHPNGNSGISAVNAAETYILCTTSVESEKMEAGFETDDGFRIVDSLLFAHCISKHIPGYKWGIEGFCTYRDDLLIKKFDGNPIKPPDEYENLEEWAKETDQYVGRHMIDGFFLKRLKFSHQSEFRFIWCGSGEERENIKIVCPEARRFCQRITGTLGSE